MHDNRAVFKDSRYWGPVPAKWIVAKVTRITPPGVSPILPLRGSDIVVAIVGGVLLVMFVTRPRIDLPKEWPKEVRRSLELGLTVLAFFVAGFAFGVLVTVVYHSSIEQHARAALWCAGGIIAIYGLVVNLEPFIDEGEIAWKSYLWTCFVAAVSGLAVANITFGTHFSVGDWLLLGVFLGLALATVIWPVVPLIKAWNASD